MREALLLYGSTDAGSPLFSGDILWRTKFRLPDPVMLAEVDGKTTLFVSSLEFGRAKREARVDEVRLTQRLVADVSDFLEGWSIVALAVPEVLPFGIAKAFEKKFTLEVKKQPFYPERAKKSKWEIGEFEKAQRATEEVTRMARDLLARAEVRGEKIYADGEALTSERVRKFIEQHLYEKGYLAVGTIVASGVQAADPHAIGTGPIVPYAPIVVDVFPMSLATHYYTDQTRTFFKGEPSKELREMYETVLDAQKLAISNIEAGVDGHDIQQKALELFSGRGYPTSAEAQPQKRTIYEIANCEGFIHGVGHGVGIDVHEPPHIGNIHEKLEKGNIVTVEPGLYYRGARGHIPAGGIRLEDIVVVKKGGCRNLTQLPKDLRWAVV